MRPLSVQFLPFHACFSKIFPNNRFLAQTQGLAPPVWEIQDSPLLASASVHRRFKPIIYTFFLYVGPSMHKFDHKQHRRLHIREKVHCSKQITKHFVLDPSLDSLGGKLSTGGRWPLCLLALRTPWYLTPYNTMRVLRGLMPWFALTVPTCWTRPLQP